MPGKSPVDQFEDPLENYDEPVFDDPIEAALHNQTVYSLQTQPFTCITAETSVRDAMKLMAGRQIACVLVQQDDSLIGIVSDRDILDRVALEYDTVIDGPVKEIMTANPVTVTENDSVAKVLAVMAVSGYRHVPVIDTHAKAIGIVSPQRMSHLLLEHLA